MKWQLSTSEGEHRTFLPDIFSHVKVQSTKDDPGCLARGTEVLHFPDSLKGLRRLVLDGVCLFDAGLSGDEEEGLRRKENVISVGRLIAQGWGVEMVRGEEDLGMRIPFLRVVGRMREDLVHRVDGWVYRKPGVD